MLDRVAAQRSEIEEPGTNAVHGSRHVKWGRWNDRYGFKFAVKARKAAEESGVFAEELLELFLHRNWGSVDEAVRQNNERLIAGALQQEAGSQIVGRYPVGNGSVIRIRVWNYEHRNSSGYVHHALRREVTLEPKEFTTIVGERRLGVSAGHEDQQKTRSDVYTLVTDNIVAALDAGTIPWHKPWAAAGGMPRNLASRKPYRGMNVLLLSLGQPYLSPWWLTFKQAQDLGGHVRKGEKSSLVTFWKFREGKKDTGDDSASEDWPQEHQAPLLRYYSVFNVEQCEGIEAPPSSEFQPKAHERLALCEELVAEMPLRPAIQRDARHACYSPALDRVGIPDLSQFETAEAYYATLFHELVHSTGHVSRLARPTLGAPPPFGTPDYSKEELVAEFGAAFLCGHAGIFTATAENQTAYINGWLAVLKKDKRLLPIAAAQAQRAADFILGTNIGGVGELPADAVPMEAAAGLVHRSEPSLRPLTPRQMDLRRVAELIGEDPDFLAGANTFSRCRMRNARHGWIYRFQPSPENPRVATAHIRLNADELDQAYQLACRVRRDRIDSSDSWSR